MQPEKKTPLQITIRILIILGLIILLFLLSFGIIKLVPKAFTGVNSLHNSFFSFLRPKEKIVVSSEPAAFQSGQDGTLTWSQSDGKTDGYYTFQYPCSDQGTTIEKNNEQDSSKSLLSCGQPFVIINATTSQTNVAHSISIHVTNTSSNEEVTETLTISHRKPDSNNIYAEGSTVIHIYPETEDSLTTPANQESSSPSYSIPSYSAPTVTNYRGPADLAITITRLGIIDPRTNRFVQTSTPNSNDRLALQFQVTNLGSRPTGLWRFTAYLPTIIPSDQIYNSALQSSIPAGKTSYFTIGFYGSRPGSNEFRVVADPQNSIPETNEANNTASTLINGYPTPYPYSTPSSNPY